MQEVLVLYQMVNRSVEKIRDTGCWGVLASVISG